jgi:hypothetical protein
MAAKYQLMIDPTPAGWAYGFPRALPEEAVMGKGSDLWIKTDFDLTKWVCSFGYPKESFQYWRVYPQEVKDMCGGVYEDELKEESTNEKMGDMKFTTAKDFMDEQKEYYYPGSDPQE